MPIPGTRRVTHLEENLAADNLVLPSAVIDELGRLEPPRGERLPPAALDLTGR